MNAARFFRRAALALLAAAFAQVPAHAQADTVPEPPASHRALRLTIGDVGLTLDQRSG